jgi:hypothetical protein
MKTTIFTLIILVVLTSCSIQGRRYRKGFHIESNLGKSLPINVVKNDKITNTESDFKTKKILSSKESQNGEPKSGQLLSYASIEKSKEVINKKINSGFTSKQWLTKIQKVKGKTVIKKNIIKQDKGLRKEAVFSVIAGSISMLIFWLPFINASLLFFVLISAMFSLIGCLAAYDVRKDKSATEEDKAIARWGRFLSVLPMAIYLAVIIYAVINAIMNFSLFGGWEGFNGP